MSRMKGKAAIAAVVLIAAVAGWYHARQRRVVSADFCYVLGDSIKTLDPAGMSWMNEIRISLGLWEGLTTYDPLTLEPDEGAAYYPPAMSEDGREYIFTIRDDARWSNGDAVTADDFVYSWRRAIEPGTAADYSFFITDTIAGASEYSTWRNEAVKVLRLLGQLERGREIAQNERGFIDGYFGIEDEGTAERDWGAMAERFREEHLAAMDARFAEVGIEALDGKRLRVRLGRPVAYFLDLTSFSTLLPVHRSIELLRDRSEDIDALTLWVYDPQWVKPDYHAKGYPGLVTNGAYQLAEWEFKNYMLFAKNEHYWDAASVRSSTIMAKIITEASTAFLAYEQGEVDWLNDISRLDFAPALVEKARAGTRDDIHIQAAFGTYFYNFNCKETLENGEKNPFADVRVRKAFTMTVDRQAIVDNVKKIGNLPARNFIPPDSIAGYVCEAGPGYDSAAARELLDEAGYAGGKGFPTVELLYNTGHGHEFVAQAVGEMWRQELGVEVRLIGKEIKTFAEDKKNQRYMICRASWFGDYGDPTTFLDMLITGNGNNDSAYSDAVYDGLMAKAARTPAGEERLALLAQAEARLLHEGVPILPIYYYVNLNAFGPNIQGLVMNARNMYSLKRIYKTSAREDAALGAER